MTDLTGAVYRKSSRSGADNNCVEVATNLVTATWRKSSRSGASNNCVEVAGNLAGVVALRDSKNPHGGAVAVAPHAFAAFLGLIKSNGVDAT